MKPQSTTAFTEGVRVGDRIRFAQVVKAVPNKRNTYHYAMFHNGELKTHMTPVFVERIQEYFVLGVED